jgi:DNA-directed RNA polymerase specialized sigma24 family protein
MPTATRQPTRTSDLIAREALALRATLIRAYRSNASREDLEDLHSQAVLELLARAERDPTLTSPDHIRNALRQKFDSRILDHHRAAAGRSPATHARTRTRPLDDALDRCVADRDPLHEAIARETLRELAVAIRELTRDQQLVLASQLNGETPRECCRHTGWTIDKYRKTAQRARARLRAHNSSALSR